MILSDRAIIPSGSYKHQNLPIAASESNSLSRSPSKGWKTGLPTPPTSPNLMRRTFPSRLSLNLFDFERNIEPLLHCRSHNIIPLPPITPISPKLFCQNIHRYEEYLSDSAMDVDEYVSLEQQEPSSLSPGTLCSSHRFDGPSSPSRNHLYLDLPPKNALLFRIDSDPRWRASSAVQNQTFNAGLPEVSPFSAFAERIYCHGIMPYLP